MSVGSEACADLPVGMVLVATAGPEFLAARLL